MSLSVLPTGETRWRKGYKERCVRITVSDWNDFDVHLGTETTYKWERIPKDDPDYEKPKLNKRKKK